MLSLPSVSRSIRHVISLDGGGGGGGLGLFITYFEPRLPRIRQKLSFVWDNDVIRQ